MGIKVEKGSKVVCIDKVYSDTCITIGKIYTIESFLTDHNGNSTIYGIYDDDGDFTFSVDSFKPLDEYRVDIIDEILI